VDKKVVFWFLAFKSDQYQRFNRLSAGKKKFTKNK